MKILSALKLLYVQVLVATVLGVLFGLFFPETGVALKPLGDAFIKVIRMIIAPVVFCTVAIGIAHMSDLKKFGRVGGKTLLYFELVSTLALFIGLVVANVTQPGAGFNIDPNTLDPAVAAQYTKGAAASTSFADQLLKIIPDTLFSPFITGDLLQVLFVAILTGFCLLAAGLVWRASCACDGASDKSFVFYHPNYRLGRARGIVRRHGLHHRALWNRFLAAFGLPDRHVLCRRLPVRGRGAGRDCALGGVLDIPIPALYPRGIAHRTGHIQFRTGAAAIDRQDAAIGASRSVVGLVIPTGYSFNLDGTNIYMTLAILFLAQATNTDLTFWQQAEILAIAMLTSKGASGVTGAGFITLAATLTIVPTIPIASLAVLVGIDRFMSQCRALTNAIGNGVATLVVARWENELDMVQLARELAAGPREIAAAPQDKPQAAPELAPAE
jgi:aerobic C4-dicarboxylate transport protein